MVGSIVPSVPLITGVVPVANVVHWFCPSSEYCSVYCKKAGVFAVPMIGVGIVTTGVTWVSLKPATGAGKPFGGVRNVSVCVASPSLPSASNAFTVTVKIPGVTDENVAVPAELIAT